MQVYCLTLRATAPNQPVYHDQLFSRVLFNSLGSDIKSCKTFHFHSTKDFNGTCNNLDSPPFISHVRVLGSLLPDLVVCLQMRSEQAFKAEFLLQYCQTTSFKFLAICCISRGHRDEWQIQPPKTLF